MPIIELLPIGGIKWNEIVINVGPADFLLGHFLGQLMTFAVIAFAILLIVKLAKRFFII